MIRGALLHVASPVLEETQRESKLPPGLEDGMDLEVENLTSFRFDSGDFRGVLI